ncbi:hypothetical protein CHGG_05789 [Chaetomium globosum CBS 148.51]|uniref:Gfd2/YDR514C-like C-terminal domain-containing protein n=1 Tax=Chaetomium globosum (strain ATCC 6205 / CBS 148.51 / DSM 1962 / NBRC 6347 / NRRL 1970) TaxID=306901 RepID=Q2H6C6_CHAGB|nr:uncharacterized protein CHGG_05789 [Chaetomium globosum CBS 148.51]EAQ89170.1 hypothetical protein CHGG_05789 [Chaetomium globosum CBS 148.51]
MADEQFMRRLQDISGDDSDMWEGFDPSAWRSHLSEGNDSEELELEQDASTPQENEYDTDDSAQMIFNFHKLSKAERARGTVKLSKARQYASEEVSFPHELAELEKVKWEETGLSIGDLSEKGLTFVPWRLIDHYPVMFVGKANGARAEPLFTPEALHDKLVWDLYYLHCPADMKMKPVIFVPTYQFQHLLDLVNAKLETQFTIPRGRNEERFTMSFGVGNSPLPRFLGRSHSAESFKTLSEAIPAPHPDDDLSKVTQLGIEEFRGLLKRTRADRKKGKKSDKNRPKRVKMHQEWGRSVKRVQRYLGLRGRAADEAAVKLDNLDFAQPMVRKPENSVLFVAIDLEAWEQDHGLITEVGIAMLDTAHLTGIAPGENGQNWLQLIEARHIRVKENMWATNSRYVHGCADCFDFGTTEFVEESLIPELIKDVIDRATFVNGGGPRSVVLVFHESSSDIKYLRYLSYYVEGARNVIDVADTREMHQFLVRSNDSASLASVLSYLDISPRFLHNAGNDAVYTLQAMVGLAVKKMGMSIEARKEKIDGHIPYADFAEKDGWTSGEDTDGGEPAGLPPLPVGWGSSEDTSNQDWGSEETGGQAW